MTTKDLANIPMTFSLIPLKENKFIDTGYKKLKAAAAGFIYFNDGAENTPGVRLDIFYVIGEESSASIYFF